jgi:FAD/FMN-containing dehydrogenase
LEETESTVTIGGGVLTGDLLSALTARGFYTTVPNSNAVGVVGAVLGSGNGPFNSLHGLMADNVVGFRIITAANGKIEAKDIHVSTKSIDEHALLSAICGGGHGLGVVISMTLHMYRVAELGLDNNDQIWQRQIIFPGPAVRDAATLFSSLLPVKGPVSATLLFVRNPPGSPRPGSPIVMVIGSFFGPATAAEASPFAAVLLSSDRTASAVMAVTDSVPVAKMNESTMPCNAHGDSKTLDATFLHELDANRIVALFEQFVAFTEGRPDLHMSYTAIAGWDKTKAEELGTSEARKNNFIISRDRSILQLNTVWSSKVSASSEQEAQAHVRKMKEIAMRGEKGPLVRFANNLAFPATMADSYPAENVKELLAVKKLWDPTGLFWSPSMSVE